MGGACTAEALIDAFPAHAVVSVAGITAVADVVEVVEEDCVLEMTEHSIYL